MRPRSPIEGTQATLGEYLQSNTEPQAPDNSSDSQEIANYVAAMNHGIERMETLPLSWRLIKEVHGRLLAGVWGQHKRPGEFRDSQNWIGGRNIEEATFVPPPHAEMHGPLSDLEKFFYPGKAKEEELPTLIKVGLIHAQFETITSFLRRKWPTWPTSDYVLSCKRRSLITTYFVFV